LRLMAEAIVQQYGGKSLADLVERVELRKLKIAEINSCGTLHQFLKELPDLAYSEYGSKDKHVPSEDLEDLSYEDDTFDLILTSDTLEHVPRVGKAFDEIRRTLKPGGYHIFTIPMILSRTTLVKATLEQDGKVVHTGKPTYHGSGEPDYLVFSEFGRDVVQEIKSHGFSVKLFNLNPINLDDACSLLITQKT